MSTAHCTMHKLSPQSGKFIYICFFLGEYKINKDQLAIFILKLKSYSKRKLGGN